MSTVAGAAVPQDAARDPAPLLRVGAYLFISIYAVEGLLRYFLNLAGADSLIFVRDAFLYLGVMQLFMAQLLDGKVDNVFKLFFALALFHALIGVLNLRQIWPVVAGAKAFFSVFAGCLVAAALFETSAKLRRWLFILWTVAVLGAFVDAYLLDWPWIGMTAKIGGVDVDVGRKWEVGIGNERVAGLARSSIHLASFAGIVGTLLIFETRRFAAKAIIAGGTLAMLTWSTQKGAILAFLLVLMASMFPGGARTPALKWLLLLALVVMVALPTISPGYIMPRDHGLFSMASFYDRIERMWPDAWDWIAKREIFPFGIGLGGIGAGLRFFTAETAFYVPDLKAYAPYLINYADNLFIYLYAQFGVFAVIYMACIYFAVLRAPGDTSGGKVKALAVLLFICTYGIVVNIIEDQIAALFLGASSYYLWSHSKRSAEAKAEPHRAYPSRPSRAARRPTVAATGAAS